MLTLHTGFRQTLGPRLQICAAQDFADSSPLQDHDCYHLPADAVPC